MEMPPARSLADYVATKVIRHARNIKKVNEDKIWCSDCKLLPIKPVTGRCGHTRCLMCIKRNGACPCGSVQPENLHSNIVVRDIVEKIMSRSSQTRFERSTPVSFLSCDDAQLSLIPTSSSGRARRSVQLSRLHRKQPKLHSFQTWHRDLTLRRIIASPQMRYEYARQLVASGRHRDAAAHLAHVAASSDSAAKMARELLTQVIATLGVSRDPFRLTRSLYQCVRQQAITSWVEPGGTECPVCYSVMAQPVTTICGHTFCRCCIKQTMLNRHICPLCASSLNDFYLVQTEDTEFVSAIVGTITPKAQITPDFIPIFACTVAFPDIPCPLMIFNRDFKNVIRSVLDSGSRRFGMLASVGDQTYANYGTIVEVRDCVVFEDGRSILSTVGKSRFRVIEKVIIDGCPYARVQEHEDITPISADTLFDLQLLARQISSRVQQWLPSLNDVLRTDIATCFGGFPEMNLEGDWWDNPNGPIWLWWLVAILPLRSEIQMLMLSTRHLMKRMMAVLRTLDAVEYYTYIYRIP